MPEPYDYASRLQQPDIAGSFLGGLRAGNVIRAERAEVQAAEDARMLQEQYKTDLQAYLAKPTAQGAAAMTAKYPKQREAFKQSWDLLNRDQQDSMFRAGTQAYSAIQSGRPDVAAQVLDEQIAARENAGQDAADLKSMRDTLDRDPKTVGGGIGLALSSLDPDKWGKIAGEMRAAEQAPFELTEKQAKAQKAAVDAKFAESMAVQDLTKKGWEIAKLQEDTEISRQNSKIAAINAQIARETKTDKIKELHQKVQDVQVKRDDAVREKVATVESARASIDNMLNTADRVLQTPMGVVGSAAGPISSKLLTTSQETADFEELVNTLSSQAFMAQIPNLKGMGALSNAEGEKLQSSLQTLSLRQSPERLLENVQEAQRLMLKARSTVAERYGVPDITPDTPAAKPGTSEIDALLQKYGG